MTGSGKRVTIGVACVAVVAGIGLWLFSRGTTEKEQVAPAASASAASPVNGAAAANPALTAMAICRKMQDATLAGNCQTGTGSTAPFEGVAFNIPQGGSAGMLAQAHDARTYGLLQQKISTGTILRFDGPRLIVQLDQDTPADVSAKIKALLDKLLGP